MSPAEWMAVISVIGGTLIAFGKILMDLRDDQRVIRRALLGDGYGHPGLVKEIEDMRASQARTEERVDEIEQRLEAIEGRAA